MGDWTIWRLIKTGFWLGIGFAIPSMVVSVLGDYAAIGMTTSMFDSEDSYEMLSDFQSERDRTAEVKILDYRESMQGEQLLILGNLENTGDGAVDSIRLEAELFDAEGALVYEWSEYISQRLGAGRQEHFQIRCGCQGQATPAYSSIEVRVISASRY